MAGAPYRFRRVASLDDVRSLRRDRIASLTALPELYAEMAARRARIHALLPPEGAGEDPVGYLAALDGTLTEIFVVPAHEGHLDDILAAARDALGVRSLWACSFDPLAMAAARLAADGSEPVGWHFRAYTAADLTAPVPLPSIRQATPHDVDAVRAVNDPEVFDDPADIPLWIGNDHVTLFEVGAEVVGFGLCTPTGPETPAADVGICVAPAHRRRGLGAWIVQRMVDRASSHGLVATAGCGVDNEASKRTLERAGFVADHRLLSFTLRANESDRD